MPSTPDDIVPDDKDWTWVLERPCPDCGFDPADHPKESIAADVRSTAARWEDALGRPDAAVRTVPDRWSVLEYGCHVRDVFRIFDVRVGLLLDEDDPGFANWDQDATAVADRYDLQDPATVAAELRSAADVLAGRFDRVSGDGWQRPGRRSNGDVFTVETLGRYMVHDPLHHLWDIGAG